MAGRLCVEHWQTRTQESCLRRIQLGASDKDQRVPGKKEAEGLVVKPKVGTQHRLGAGIAPGRENA